MFNLCDWWRKRIELKYKLAYLKAERQKREEDYAKFYSGLPDELKTHQHVHRLAGEKIANSMER